MVSFEEGHENTLTAFVVLFVIPEGAGRWANAREEGQSGLLGILRRSRCGRRGLPKAGMAFLAPGWGCDETCGPLRVYVCFSA